MTGADFMAQELFVQYLAEQGHNMAKLDRKPRRNIQYKDLCKGSLVVSSRSVFAAHTTAHEAALY